MKTHFLRGDELACGRTCTVKTDRSRFFKFVTCKNCIKVAEKEERESFVASNGEMPSLEEIADETPLPVPATPAPVPVPVIATAATDSAIRTREEWLIKAVEMLTKIFEAQGFKVPQVRISVGWPGGKTKKGLHQTIGQCWNSASAKDGIQQIFISPLMDDPAKILATIMHELVHAVDGCKNAHKAPFKRIAVLVGLTGKMTATTAGEMLQKVFPAIIEKLGVYDHASLNPGSAIGRVQTNKHMKICCQNCAYQARTTRKQLDEYGISQHCGEDMYEA